MIELEIKLYIGIPHEYAFEDGKQNKECRNTYNKYLRHKNWALRPEYNTQNTLYTERLLDSGYER